MGRRGRLAALTLIEVLVALGIVAIAITILTSVSVSVLRTGSTTNLRTQSAQVLSYLGRRVAGGSNDALPPAGETFEWAYGELGEGFPDLAGAQGVADVDRYRATIRSQGDVSFVGASAVRYDIDVCTEASTGETCIGGVTFGPTPAPSGTTPPMLPGIN